MGGVPPAQPAKPTNKGRTIVHSRIVTEDRATKNIVAYHSQGGTRVKSVGMGQPRESYPECNKLVGNREFVPNERRLRTPAAV